MKNMHLTREQLNMTRKILVRHKYSMMTAAKFSSLCKRDFNNGEIIDEIYAALKSREELLESCRWIGKWAKSNDGGELDCAVESAISALRIIGEYEK
jgi:hypothetical protein